MIKVDVFLQNDTWKKYISNPKKYLNNKLKIIDNTSNFFKKQKFKFSILLVLEGCVLKNCGGSLPLFASLILSHNFVDSLILNPDNEAKIKPR